MTEHESGFRRELADAIDKALPEAPIRSVLLPLASKGWLETKQKKSEIDKIAAQLVDESSN